MEISDNVVISKLVLQKYNEALKKKQNLQEKKKKQDCEPSSFGSNWNYLGIFTTLGIVKLNSNL
jgi:hypothetical protein